MPRQAPAATDVILSRLARSRFRSRFHLGVKERDYANARGRSVIARHAADFIATRLAAAEPAKDGRQTPMRGHPAFVAQHATATCCRGCVAKWHAIPRHRPLTEEEQARLVAVIMAWIDREMGLPP